MFRQTRPYLAIYSHIVLFDVSEDELMRRTRAQYPGALQVGRDLMVIEIQNEVQVRTLHPTSGGCVNEALAVRIILSPSSVTSCCDAAFQNPARADMLARHDAAPRRVVSAADRALHRSGTLPTCFRAVKCAASACRHSNRTALRSEPILLWPRRPWRDTMALFYSQQPAASCYNARSRSEPHAGRRFDARPARSSRSYWRTSRRVRIAVLERLPIPILGVHRAEGEVSFKNL